MISLESDLYVEVEWRLLGLFLLCLPRVEVEYTGSSVSDSSPLPSMLVLSISSDLYLDLEVGRELPGELLELLIVTVGVAGLILSARDSSEEK